jgi:hypothetical protein
MRARQRGAGLLIPVLLVVTIAAFAVIVAASQSGGDIQGTDANADSLQALLVAETGTERALKRFATGTACGGALTEAITDLSTIGLGTTAYRINIGAGLATDFSGAALPATQCRVPVTGTVLATNVSRTIHAIVDRNLLEGPDNPTFNNPTTAGAPSGWMLTQPAGQTGYADNGGPDLEGATCSRSAWVLKNRTGNYEARAQGLTAVNFTATGGSATTVTFHYRIHDRTPNAGCTGGGANVGPGNICGGAGGREGTVCFRTTDSGGTNSTGTFNSDSTASTNVGCPDTGAITAFAPCQNGYQAAYPTKGSVSFNIGGGGTRTITTFRYMLRLQRNGRREMFLDHIEMTNNTAVGAAYVRVWRDCSTAACP